MAIRNVHIVPSGQEWVVEISGRIHGPRYATRQEAIDAARPLARDQQAEMVLHERDGTLVEITNSENPMAGEEGSPSHW